VFVFEHGGLREDFSGEYDALSAEACDYYFFVKFVILHSHDYLLVPESAEGEGFGHFVFDPFHCFLGFHSPVCGAGAEYLDEGQARFVFELSLEGVFDGFFGFSDLGGVVEGASLDEFCAWDGGEHFADLEGAALECFFSACGGGGGDLVEDGSGGHLTACHTKDGVVDEDDGELFASMGGVDYFAGANAGQVSVALVGEDYFVGVGAFHSGGDGGRAAVGDFDHVDVDVVVCEYGAANGGDADSDLADFKFVNCFGDEAMCDAVATATAVVCGDVF